MSSPETLLLIPGMACDERLWQDQVRDLAGDAECVVLLPGHHDSIAAMAADILDRAPARFALAGLSLGGYIALEIMRVAADRVTRLALLDTTALADTPERREGRKALVALMQAGDFETVYRQRVLPKLVAPARLDDLALIETVTAMARRAGLDRFIEQTVAAMNRVDSRPSLSDIRCPTVILCGREDAVCSVEEHEMMANAIPSARLAVLDACGHLASLEQPSAVSSVLRQWLNQAVPEPSTGRKKSVRNRAAGQKRAPRLTG